MTEIGRDDPSLEPPPETEEEEIERRGRITLRELAEWYQEHHIHLTVILYDWEPDGRNDR